MIDERTNKVNESRFTPTCLKGDKRRGFRMAQLFHVELEQHSADV